MSLPIEDRCAKLSRRVALLESLFALAAESSREQVSPVPDGMEPWEFWMEVHQQLHSIRTELDDMYEASLQRF